MKKSVALIASALMCAFLFACGTGGDTGNISGNGSDAASSAPEQASSAAESSALPVSGRLGESVRIAVLGDSIAHGYGLPDIEGDRFSARLETMLGERFDTVSVVNYGIDGLTGGGLCERLRSGEFTEGLRGADYVLVSIGGNNILQGLSSLEGFSELLSMGGSGTLFSDYAKLLLGAESPAENNPVIKRLETLISGANAVFEGSDYKALIDKAYAGLSTELREIYALIKGIEPNAKVIVQTVYSPYIGMNISLPLVEAALPLGEYSDAAVGALNRAINGSADCGYAVLDVCAAFAASNETLTNAGLDLVSGMMLDPHPNIAGHKLIAELYYKYITEE